MQIQFIQSHDKAKDQHHKVTHETSPERDDIGNLLSRSMRRKERLADKNSYVIENKTEQKKILLATTGDDTF